MKNNVFIIIILFLSLNFNYSYCQNNDNLEPMPLDYSFEDIDDFIDKREFEYLYNNNYIVFLEKIKPNLKKDKSFCNCSLKSLLENLDSLSEEIVLDVKENASEAYNLECFFKSISKNPSTFNSAFLNKIDRQFKGLSNFKEKFKKEALLLKEPGYVFLITDESGKLYITTSEKMYCPVVFKKTVLLCLYLDKNLYSDKKTYIENFFNFANYSNASLSYKNRTR